jgi:hypothetical protein
MHILAAALPVVLPALCRGRRRLLSRLCTHVGARRTGDWGRERVGCSTCVPATPQGPWTPWASLLVTLPLPLALTLLSQVSAELLRYLVDLASQHLSGHTPQQVVITVPAYFDTQQRQATLEAAKLAGISQV